MHSQPMIFITGGAGYIGSHTAVELLAAGFRIAILDNFENSARDVPGRISRISGESFPVIDGDVRDQDLVSEILKRYQPELVMHFAGKKAVGESVARPLFYYQANLDGGLSLLEAMEKNGVRNLIFSSSATVYASVDGERLDETAFLEPSNPYGRTKLMLEEIISDAVAANALGNAISLRYFNPVGAHSSGLIGEDPCNTPNNLFPLIAQTAAGLRESVLVFGDDYPTLDGTGVRDFIHVVDLAKGHVAAANHLLRKNDFGAHLSVNLGTGSGYSVLQAITAFSEACGFEIPHKVVGRRPGDIASCIADATLAEKMLDWRATLGLQRMCADQWAYQKGRLATSEMEAEPLQVRAVS